MGHYLLTGAGFSRNWGGWLANEVFEYLLADKDLTVPIRTQLWRDRNSQGNFEDTVQHFRVLAQQGDPSHYNFLMSVLAGMFNAMRNGFISTGFKFEFQTNDMNMNVAVFLQKFEAIFTLNQDSLMEAHYLNDDIAGLARSKWNGWQIPGLENPPHPLTRMAPMDRTMMRTARLSGFALSGRNEQPYYKLHGSHNWNSGPTSSQLLIMGGNKESDIGQSPLLQWYANQFRQAVVTPNARLMIVGYSFSDRHINRVLRDAQLAGAKFFIVDPLGVDAMDKRKVSDDSITYGLWDTLYPGIIGASRRPLSSTFSSDRVEHAKLMHFFQH